MKQRLFKVFPALFVVMAAVIFLMYVNAAHSQPSQQAPANLTKSTTAVDPNNQFTLSLSSPRSNYSLGENIVIFGNLSSGKKASVNESIKIEVLKDSTVYYTAYVVSDKKGRFTDVFSIPTEGIIRISATPTHLASNATKLNAILPVSIMQPKQVAIKQQLQGWGIIVPFLSIIANVAIIVLSYPKYERIGLIAAIASAAIGTFFLFFFAPQSIIGNLIIEGAVLTSLSTYVYATLKDRRIEGHKLEEAVGTYRNEQLKSEVKSLSDIFEELSVHQSIFKSANDLLDKRLSREKYNSSIKTGTMANLPGLRINQYYYYVDYFNKVLEYKVKKLGDLSDDKKYQEFLSIFQDTKNTFSKLNELLYVNVLYSISEIQSRFLSFPTVEFPIRTSRPLLDTMLKANILTENGLPPTDIYSRENAGKLMSVIGHEFTSIYNELEIHMSKLIKFVPPLNGGAGNVPPPTPPAAPAPTRS
jgi:hypothetical protein